MHVFLDLCELIANVLDSDKTENGLALRPLEWLIGSL